MSDPSEADISGILQDAKNHIMYFVLETLREIAPKAFSTRYQALSTLLEELMEEEGQTPELLRRQAVLEAQIEILEKAVHAVEASK